MFFFTAKLSAPFNRSTLSSSPQVSSKGLDWLWLPLTCGPIGGVEVRMGQKSRSKFQPWSGFEPRTNHLATQHTTARPPRTPLYVINVKRRLDMGKSDS